MSRFSYLIPLTRTEVKHWVSGCSDCSVCGERFTVDRKWAFLLSNRLYMICAHCAINWAEQSPVIAPAHVPGFIARHSFKSNCRGMALELMNGERFSHVLESEAVALYKRLASGQCDACGGGSSRGAVEIQIGSRYCLVCLCHGCQSNVSSINLERFEISAHLADVVARRYPNGMMQ